MMGTMKARWESKCGRCGRLILVGNSVSSKYGNLWHMQCVTGYVAERQALAASGWK